MLLWCSIADFLKELPGQVRLLIPAIPPRYAEDAERKIEVKEIQTSLVHSFLLSKKAKVNMRSNFWLRPGFCPSERNIDPKLQSSLSFLLSFFTTT